MSELEKRNVISTIEECLKEHEVAISDGKITYPFYLIEVNAGEGSASDFKDTFQEASPFQRKVSERALGEAGQQTYGVLVDPELKFRFAFNRKFADLDRKNNRIAFRDMEDILLGAIEEAEGPLEGVFELPISDPDEGFPGDLSNMTLRYAIQGAKNTDQLAVLTSNIRAEEFFGRPSMLDRISSLYSKSRVKLKTNEGPQELILIPTDYNTSLLEDFEKTYSGEISEFQMKLARKAFGKKKTRSAYGVFMTDDLQMVGAFNRRFAKYDSKRKRVVYTPVEEVLLANTSGDLAPQEPSTPPRRFPWGRGPGIVVRYALVGKKE